MNHLLRLVYSKMINHRVNKVAPRIPLLSERIIPSNEFSKLTLQRWWWGRVDWLGCVRESVHPGYLTG